MALSWTAAMQDEVSLAVLQKTYSGLRDFEKTTLDGTVAVPSSAPTGVAGRALDYVNLYAQWFAEATEGTANTPANWAGLLVAETTYRFCKAVRREDAKEFGSDLARVWAGVLDAYANVDAKAGAVQDATLSMLVIRMFCIRHLIRRRPRAYVPVATIDRAMRAALDEMWYWKIWQCRVRLVTITLPSATPSLPTMDLPTGEVFHSIVSPWLTFDQDSAVRTMPTRCTYADSQRLAEALANTGVDDGMPEMFSFERRGDGTLYWRWFPAPDVDYTFKAQVAIAAPTFPTSITSTTEFAKIPSNMQTLFPLLTLAHAMRESAVPGWEETWTEAHNALNGPMERTQERGLPEQYCLEAENAYPNDGFGQTTPL